MLQEGCVPFAIDWREHNPYQALPEHLAQSCPELKEHSVGYVHFEGMGYPNIYRRFPANHCPVLLICLPSGCVVASVT
jgi:hypothetical protein